MYYKYTIPTNKPIISKYYNLTCRIEFGHSARKRMSVSMMVILGMILLLHSRQFDAFIKRPLFTKRHQHKLFSWQEEAIKGVVTISSLLIFINLNDKRISEAGAASDKRFADLLASHSTIRSADKDTLNAIVQKLSTEIQASNARTDAEIKASNARTDEEIKASNARVAEEVKDAYGRLEEMIVRKRKFF